LQSPGKLYIIGTGPGGIDHMSLKAVRAIKDSEYIIGHATYIHRVKELLDGKKIIYSSMGKEVARVKKAIELAGKSKVSLLSGGDPGFYGMLPLVAEIIASYNMEIDWESIPGISAVNAVNSLLGSPISGDCAIISLSDLLIPWEEIEKKLRFALKADFTIAIYNPSSRTRKPNLKKAIKIIKEIRGDCWIGVVRNAMRMNQSVKVYRLKEFEKFIDEIDMNTTIIVGNSKTIFRNGILYTPRGYGRKYDI